MNALGPRETKGKVPPSKGLDILTVPGKNITGKSSTGHGKPHQETTMKVTEKGQVTIPIEIRQKLGILPHTEVEFAISGRNVILRKVRNQRSRGTRLVAAMRGRASRKLATDEIMALTRGE